MRNPWELQQAFSNRRVDVFAREVLGLPSDPAFEHKGQTRWLNNSWKLINILKPGNQWGKTMAVAIKHIYHAMCKPQLRGRISNPADWFKITYRTLNVGKTYEIAKGVMEAIKDICEGEVLLPDGSTNKSMLKGWAIARYIDTTNKPPEVHWWDNSVTLIRSYDDLGSSFKRLKLAYVSSDECGDIPELRLFLNGTMLPRVAFWQGQVDLIGTHQAKGLDYLEIVDEAKADIERSGADSDYYLQEGTLYENPYMSQDFIKRLDLIADERLRKQIIYGEYVDDKQHFFTFDEVDNAFRSDIDWDDKTGFCHTVRNGVRQPAINPAAKYVFSVDLAATEDETAATCVEYGLYSYHDILQKSVELPYRIAFHMGFQGKLIPISMQYELIRSWFLDIKKLAEGENSKLRKVAFVFDEGSLGGKNAADAFKDLHGYGFPGQGKSYVQEKAYAIGNLKEILGRGRRVVTNSDGKREDVKKNWGFLRASDKLKELRRQFEIYALDDKGIRQDRLATVWQAVHFIEKRRPRVSHNRAEDLDILSSTIPHHYGQQQA